MKKTLLILSCLLGGFGLVSAQDTPAEPLQDIKIVSENITVPSNYDFRMFIEDYNEKMYKLMSLGRKIVIRYTPEDPSIVSPFGNSFKAMSVGTTNVTLDIAAAYQGTLDSFVQDSIIASKTFQVTVVDDSRLQETLPINFQWGQTREECIDSKVAQGAEHASEKLWKMHPSVEEEYRAHYEAFFNHSFEFPMTQSYFNSMNQLIQETYVLPSWSRCQYPNISTIYKMLKENGFEDMGTTHPQTGRWWMYSSGMQAEATSGYMALQGTMYAFFSLDYNPEKPNPDEETGIECAPLETPEYTVNRENGMMFVNADAYVGQTLTVYNLAGQVVAQEIVSEGGNNFSGLDNDIVVVKIGQTAPVKVMPW